MATRTANSLAACTARFQKEAELKDALMARLFTEGASLAEIQTVLERGGLTMSRAGIRGVLLRRGIDTGRGLNNH